MQFTPISKTNELETCRIRDLHSLNPPERGESIKKTRIVIIPYEILTVSHYLVCNAKLYECRSNDIELHQRDAQKTSPLCVGREKSCT